MKNQNHAPVRGDLNHELIAILNIYLTGIFNEELILYIIVKQVTTHNCDKSLN